MDRVQDAILNGVELPNHLARRFFPQLKGKHHKESIIVTPKAALLVYRGHTTTAFPFNEDAYYCVLVYYLTGIMPFDHPVWNDRFV
jgi:hypothetical protein